MLASFSPLATISAFYGVSIRLHFSDQPPPHFHARYGEFEATIAIETLEIIEGELPTRALNLVLEWAMMYRKELSEGWALCRVNAVPAKIQPLT
jgi:hypothetical protein